MASEPDVRINIEVSLPEIGIGVIREDKDIGISVSKVVQNISLGVDRSAKDIGLAVDRRWKTVEFEINKGGEYHLPYDGPYEADASFYRVKTLQTYGRYMRDNVKVNRIPVLEVSNPQGGKTITIGA